MFWHISDKGGGRHGHHVCVRSVVGRRQGRAGQLPRGSGGRAEASKAFHRATHPATRRSRCCAAPTNGKRGCGTGDLRDNNGSNDDPPSSSSSSYEDVDADIRRRRPARPRGRSAARSGPTYCMNNIASAQQINLVWQLIASLIILVTLSLTRTIGVTINYFINYTRNIECNELQFIFTVKVGHCRNS
jgi:hypothetical protein